ncbi:MAG: MobA/MobL family protein [Selenomonadaceae bacterium]|nr:MobA/MobL family protein [Selenomonadaceae bacterium]MDY2685764.1 MobA/MobL family protein [Selenomonadaceae bacterium]
MAIYYLRMSNKSGAKGKNPVASAAYQSGERLYDQIEEKVKRANPERSERIRATGILAPDNAPSWAKDRERLWNEVQKKEGPRGRYCRSWTLALPREFSLQQQIDLAEQFIQTAFVARGMVADYAVHIDKDATNPHLHVMTTTRSFRENGAWAPKARKVFERDENGKAVFSHRDKNGKKIYKFHKETYNDWDAKETLKAIRAEWADAVNDALGKAGCDDRIDCRSNKERGIEKLPTIHEGYAARAMERGGEVSVRCEYNRRVRAFNKKWEAYRNEKARRAEQRSHCLAAAERVGGYVRPEALQYVDELGCLSDMRERRLDAVESPEELDVLLCGNASKCVGQHRPAKSSDRVRVLGADFGAARASGLAGFESLSPEPHITLIVQTHNELVARERAIESERRRLREALVRNPRLKINMAVSHAQKRLESARAEQNKNAGRLDELQMLLSDKYRTDREPRGILAIRDRRRWREERKGVQAEITRCKEMDGKLTARVKRAEKALLDAQMRQQTAIDKMIDAQMQRKHPELQAVRKACKTLSSSVKRIERKAEQIAGKRGRSAVKRAVAAATSKPTIPQVKAVSESVMRGAGLPPTLVGSTKDNDDRWMRNWALMTDAAKEEEANKRVYHDI